MLHVNTPVDESYAFPLQQLALQRSRPTGQQNPAETSEHSLPGYASGVGIAQGPGNLPRNSWMTCGARHVALGCDFAAGNAAHRPLDVLVISHDDSRTHQHAARCLTRIAHRVSTAASHPGMSTALISVGLLGVPSSTPAGPSAARLVSMPVCVASLDNLVRKAR